MDFIIVGGVSAVIHGAPVTTFDLDVVHSRTSENIARILAALKDLDAFYRGRGDQRLRPTAAHLASPGHQLSLRPRQPGSECPSSPGDTAQPVFFSVKFDARECALPLLPAGRNGIG
ncbi:MAG: hypothetical protein AB9866_12215 [Syntrophobacteraceae bacterium]